MPHPAAEKAGQPKQPASFIRTLRPVARAIFYIGPASLVLLTLVISPKLTALLPLISVPSLVALRHYCRLQPSPTSSSASESRIDASTLITTFALAFLAVPISSLVQLTFGYPLYYAFHSEDTLKYLASAIKPRAEVPVDVLVARAALAWREGGGQAECLKLGCVMLALKWNEKAIAKEAGLDQVAATDDTAASSATVTDASTTQMTEFRRRRISNISQFPRAKEDSLVAPCLPRTTIYLTYALTTGLAFSFVESLFGAYAFIAQFNKPQSDNVGSDPVKWAAIELLERIIQGTAGHVLMTVLASLRFRAWQVRRSPSSSSSSGSSATTVEAKSKPVPLSLTFLNIVAPSALYHGTFNFLLFSISHMNGNLTWKHPTPVEDGWMSLGMGYAVAVGTMGMLVWHVERVLCEPPGHDGNGEWNGTGRVVEDES